MRVVAKFPANKMPNIYGHEPSVKECLEYKPQSLEPVFAMFYRGRFPWQE